MFYPRGILAAFTITLASASSLTPLSQLFAATEPQAATTSADAMIWIPAGSFKMGTSPDYEGAHDPDERPLRTVTLTQGFWIARNETTNAEYAKFLAALAEKKGDDSEWRHPEQPKGAGGGFKDHTPQYWDDANLNAPNLPVVGVDWWDAYAYAKWAGMRLPTEAEWELTARGTDGRLYLWGEEWPPKKKWGNFADASLDKVETGNDLVEGGYDDGFPRTSPVGSFPDGASWSGAMDLAGNVWEWCQDRYAAYDPAATIDPRGPEEATGRAVRGASWRCADGADFRCAFRDNYDPEFRQDDLGFRVARDFDEAKDGKAAPKEAVKP